ncbi:hypothetical protein RhiirA5_358009, partial [Rhizophagus irregularis]
MFSTHYLVKSLILVVEAKRKHVLEDIKEQSFPDFYQASEKARMVIQQRYGILTTYDNH